MSDTPLETNPTPTSTPAPIAPQSAQAAVANATAPNNGVPPAQPSSVATGSPQTNAGDGSNDQPYGPNKGTTGTQGTQPPKQADKGTTDTQPQQDSPFTRAAHAFRGVAETLAGGPRYRVTTDPVTGQVSQKPVPLSKSQIGMAIALEAITGAFAGLKEGRGKGPGAAGMAGVQQGMKQTQQRDAQLDSDYARQASIAKTNMEIARNQIALSQADDTMHQQHVDIYKPVMDQLEKLSAIDDYDKSADEVHAMMQDGSRHITKDMVIPMRVVPKIGPDGKPVLGDHGQPVYEERYAIIKPSAQITLPKDVQDVLVKHRVKGYVDSNGKAIPLPDNLELRAHQVVNGIEQAEKYRINDAGVNGWNKGYQHPLHSGTSVTDNFTTPEIKDQQIADLADAKAKKYGLNPAVLRSLILTESQGNPNAKSPKGATGLGQLMPATAKAYGVTDPKDPEQNLDATAHFLSDLTKEHKGDVKLALAAYHGIGSDGNTTHTQYVDQIMNRIQPAGDVNDPNRPKLMGVQDAIDKGILSEKDLDTMNAIGGLPELLRGDQSTKDLTKYAEAHPKQISSDSLGRVLAFAGDAINYAYDNKQQAAAKQKADLSIWEAGEKNRQKQEEDQRIARENQKFIHQGPDGFRAPADWRSLGPSDLELKLKDAGVTDLPESFDTLYKVAHYQVTPQDFAQRVWAKGTPGELDRQTAINFITKFINPYFDEREYEAQHQLWKRGTDPDSKFSQQVTSFQQMLQHVGEAMDANQKYSRTDAGKYFNKPISWWKDKMSGDPAYTDLIAAIQPAAKEYESFLLNNHALHETDRKEIADIVDGNSSMTNALTVLKRWAETAAYRAKDTDDKWYRVSGHHYPDFINTPALTAIGKLKDETGRNKVAEILADLDSGGDLQESATGWGNPGQSVGSATGVYPQGKGQKIDQATAQTFLKYAGGNPAKARQLATDNHWVF